MRTFIQRTAGGTFFGGSPLTTVVRKNHVEYVVNLGKGYYAVVNLFLKSDTEVILIADWGTFLYRIYNNTDKGALFRKLEKLCPTLVDLFTNEKNQFATMTLPDLDIDGIGTDVKVDTKRTMIEIMGDITVIKKVGELTDYCLKIYNEIAHNCPFPGWKKGLVEDM